MNDTIVPVQHPTETNTAYEALISMQGVDLEQFENIHTQVHAWTTEAGAGVKFVETRGLPIIDIILRFKAGSTQDTDQPGLAELTLYMLDEGSQRHTAAQQAEQFERLGAVVEKHVRLEHATLSLRSLSKQALFDPALELFIDLAAHPAFDASALEKLKSQLLALHASYERYPKLRARNEACRHLFRGHPYANTSRSSEDGVASITVDDLANFHQRAYCASNLEMVVVGDLSLTEAQALSQRISQALPSGWTAAELPAVPAPVSTSISVEQPGANNALLLALPMNIPANDPEYLALGLACEVFGTGLESRLMAELRQRRGLTYGIYNRVSPLSAGGLYTIEWEIASQYVQGSQELVESLLRKYIDEGPSHAELARARKQLAGQLLRGVAQNKRLATFLTEVSHQRLPADHLNSYIGQINGLTPADIRAVLQRRLDLNHKVLVSVGPSVEQQPLPDPDQ